MKFLRVLCVVALVFAFTAVANAETQSVNVSGDIALRAFARDNYDLKSRDKDLGNAGLEQNPDWASFLQSTAEVQIDADLTDNVSGVIRLVNQRVWGDEFYTSSGAGEPAAVAGVTDTPIRNATNPVNGDAFNVNLDLAYIELKEFLYAPLTLKIGRQDLWFGKGFIVGANMADPSDSIYAKEYTAIRSFDAIRATLDYDPWTIDAVYAKISENARRVNDDINLMGLNVGYVFDEYNGEAEAYWWYKQDKNPGRATTVMTVATLQPYGGNNDVNTFGLRGSFDPIDDWTVALEGAFQGGQFLGIANQNTTRNRSAWALDAAVECRYFQDQYDWRPVLGAEYIFYSGSSGWSDRDPNTGGEYGGWDRMYRGKFDTAIREYQNWFYRTDKTSSPAFTNQHQFLLRGSIEPTDDITFNATYGNFWLAVPFSQNSNTSTYVGQEVDLDLNWDYTEDVQFGLLAGWFFPGQHFNDNLKSADIAADLVGTVKLSF
ncbi:alginate export family protein [Candidatus Omnitrophota bacterium]